MEKQSLLAIKQNKLLTNIDPSSIDFSNIKGELITLNQGGILYREGYKAESVFLIISGEINILKKNLYGKTQSLIFNENSCFGYKEIIDGGIRTSTAVALKDCYIIQLGIDELDSLINQSNEIEKNIIRTEEEISFNNSIKENKTELPIENEEELTDTDEIELDNLLNNSVPENEEETEIESNENSEDEYELESDELDDSAVEQTVPEEFEINENSKNEEEVFLLGEPKDQTEISKVAEADDEIPKTIYRRKDEAAKDQSIKIDKEDKSQFSEEDDAFFANISEENKLSIEDEVFIPSEESDESVLDEETENDSLKITERFNIDDDYPTEIIKDEITLEDFAEDYSKEIVEEHTGADENINKESTEEEVDKIETEEQSEKKIEDSLEVQKVNDNKELTSEQLQMINKAAHSVTSNVQIDEVLKNIVEAACGLTKAERGTLYLVDKENNELWSKIITESSVKEIRLNIGEGIAGWVAERGEIINITNVEEDQRFKRDYDRSSGYKTKNMLCFPLKNKEEETIGVIQLLNSKNGLFSSKDEQFLDALSAHASAALINAELVEKLLKSERVTSLGKMANFLIQDIKKPVLVSKRYAEHLKTKELPRDVKQVLEMMLEQLNHVADIVQTTSSYSEGKTVLRSVSASLNETLDDYINRVDTFLRSKSCSITTQYDIDVNVKIDLKEFFQAFNHIVKNACEAMPDGGTVLISTSRNEQTVDISFKDNGLGIPDSIIDKIFEPFMTHGKKEGTGLGLSITKKIIEDHSGTISVSSDLGEKTIFKITLPIVSSF